MSLLFAPATPSASRRQRMVGPVAGISTLALATLALHVRDPHASGSWGFCPSALMGFWCPGCGGLRAVNDLTNFRFADAASSNLAFIVLLPIIVFLLGRWVLDRWRGVSRPPTMLMTGVTGGVVVAGLTVFAVLRNLPAFAWLAP